MLHGHQRLSGRAHHRTTRTSSRHLSHTAVLLCQVGRRATAADRVPVAVLAHRLLDDGPPEQRRQVGALYLDRRALEHLGRIARSRHLGVVEAIAICMHHGSVLARDLSIVWRFLCHWSIDQRLD